MSEIKDLAGRLTSQLAAKGVDDAAGKARSILIERGHMNADGTLTAAGKARQALGAEGGAKDRAARDSKHTVREYTYDQKTNRATLKK